MRSRIAVVTTSWPWSEGDPAGHFVRAEVRALRDAGAEVIVIAPRPGEGDVQGERTISPGIDVVPIPAFGAFGFPGVLARIGASPWRALGAARFVTAGRAALRHAGPYDRVIAHWAIPSVYPLLVGTEEIELSATVEVVSHGADVRVLEAMPSPLRAHVVGRILVRARSWRFVSEGLAEQLRSALSSHPALADAIRERTTVAPAPFELPDVTAAAAELARRHGPFVASVGRLITTKHVDVAIRAAHAEAKRLVVVGDGPERARLERLSRGLRSDVTFTGLVPREQALAWIAASEALWFASSAEGTSTVVREARALGRPVRHL